jgi:hypothetical protein
MAAAPAGAQRRNDGRQGPARRAVPRDDRGRPGPGSRETTIRPYTVFRDAPRGYGRTTVRVAPRVLGPRAFIIGGQRLYRPYYTFRPRVSLSFGIWIGHPVAYPYYEVPYVYSPYAQDPYGYSAQPYGYDSYRYGTAATVQPGGLSFIVSPAAAEVFVDGMYVGRADEFGPDCQPLGLMAGRHHVEFRAGGFRGAAFEADVIAGQVVPYRVELRR